MSSVSKHPTHKQPWNIIFSTNLKCIQPRELADDASEKKRQCQQSSILKRWQTSLQMAAQFSDEEKNTLSTSNLYGEAKYKHWLLRGNYKQMKVQMKANLAEFLPLPLKAPFDGILNWLVPNQFNSMTSIFEQLMYTVKVARLVTPELHNQYVYNWNWI